MAYYCGVAFAGYAAISSLWSPYNANWFLLALVSAFGFGYFMRSMLWVWYAYAAFLVLNVLVMLIPEGWFGFALPWGIYGNPNYFGCALAIGLASALAYRLWIAIPPLVLGVWLTQSRGALLGASAALFIWLWPRYKTTAFTLAAAGVIAILASQHSEANGAWQRLGIWQDTLNHLTIQGAGFGSFYDAYGAWPLHRNIGFARAEHAYNDYLELLFELGLATTLLWVFLIKVMSQSQHKVNLVIWTYLVLALTYFPLWVHPVGPLVACTLGHLVRESDGT